MLIHTQIRNVFVFIYLLLRKFMYKFGYISVFYLERSSSRIKENTGSEVYSVAYPNISIPL